MPLHCRYGPEPLLVQQEHYLQERVAGTGVHLPLRNLYVRLLHVKRVWALLDQPAVPRETKNAMVVLKLFRCCALPSSQCQA